MLKKRIARILRGEFPKISVVNISNAFKTIGIYVNYKFNLYNKVIAIQDVEPGSWTPSESKPGISNTDI